MRITSAGHAVFAVVLIAIGVAGIRGKDFLWGPPDQLGASAQHALVYAGSVLANVCGVGMLIDRTAALAAKVFFLYLAAWTLVFGIFGIALMPKEFGAWDGLAEGAVIVAGAWVLSSRLASEAIDRRVGVAGAARGPTIARVIFALSLVPFGIAHFLYLERTTEMVPSVLPAHLAFAVATGVAFFVAALAILTGICARLAAALVTIQIGGFVAFVWIPMIATTTLNAFEWTEVGVSIALFAASWLVTESYA